MPNTNKEIVKDVYAVIDSMKKYMGLRIPRSRYPDVKITSRGNAPSYVASTNTIELSSEDDLMSGRTIGEEVGHYLRETLNPSKSNEVTTDEFFGYLGARVMYKIAKQKRIDKQLFPHGEPNYRKEFLGTQSMVVERLKGLKRNILKKARKYTNTKRKKKKKRIKREGRELVEEREDILHHFRPYKFASHVSLDNLDFGKLYRMANEKVREKYFERRGLETKIATVIFLFVISLTIFGFSMTGNVIGESTTTRNISGILTFVVGLVFVYLLNQ